MDIMKRALLGNKKAQEELTEKGELLPCPICNNHYLLSGQCTGNMNGFDCIECNLCGVSYITLSSPDLYMITKEWNDRPQILTDEEMERLEGLE